MAPSPPSKAKRSPAQLRKALLDDPNTKGIARNLGVSVEHYVSQVVHFATHPAEEPSLYVVEDADLEAAGHPPPDADAMGRYLLQALQVQAATEVSDYRDGATPAVALPQAPAAQAAGRADPGLKAEVERELRSRRGRKG